MTPALLPHQHAILTELYGSPAMLSALHEHAHQSARLHRMVHAANTAPMQTSLDRKLWNTVSSLRYSGVHLAAISNY